MKKTMQVLTILGWLISPLLASAQRPVSVDRELALALAKTTWNEGSSYASPDEMYLLWQVIEGRGRTNRERLAWLRSHSSCVNTLRPIGEGERRTNCRWSRYLTWGSAKPVGWPAGIPWEGASQRRWAQTRELALRLVRGADYPRPCEMTPTTWGGPMDHERAHERGLVPLDCVGAARNTGFVPLRHLAG